MLRRPESRLRKKQRRKDSLKRLKRPEYRQKRKLLRKRQPKKLQIRKPLMNWLPNKPRS